MLPLPYELYIISGITTIAGILWIYLFFTGKKFEELIKPLPENQFWLKEFYVIGFRFFEFIGYSFKSSRDKKVLGTFINVYGERYAQYYMRVNYAQRFTVAISVFLAFGLLSILGQNSYLVIVGAFLAVTGYIYIGMTVVDKLEEKEKELLRDFPDVLSKLTLLINAGMIMAEAWNKVSFTGEGRIYQEMRITTKEIENGTSDIDAYSNFGNRCAVNEIRKFTSTLIQNLTKGNKELVEFLKAQSKESWESKKHRVKRIGEQASSKLLIPIGIMFVGILVIVVVPIMGNLMKN